MSKPSFSLLTVLAILVTTLTVAVPTALTTSRSEPDFCTPNQRFTIGYAVCTFACLINPSYTSHLWLFDSNFNVIGEAASVNVHSETPEGVRSASLYNLDSELRYVAVTDLKDGQSPVVLHCAGKAWGGKSSQCWRDGSADWVCSFDFDC